MQDEEQTTYHPARTVHSSPVPKSVAVSANEKVRARAAWLRMRQALEEEAGNRLPLDVTLAVSRVFILGWTAAARRGSPSDALRGCSVPVEDVESAVSALAAKVHTVAELGQLVRYHGSDVHEFGRLLYVTGVEHFPDRSGRTQTRYSLDSRFPGPGRPLLSGVRPQSLTRC